jgi:hypothetical protein
LIRSTIALTLSATIGSFPVLIFHFWSFPLYSILVNILVAWFLGWILLWSTIFWILTILWAPFLKYIWLWVYIPIDIIKKISLLFWEWVQLTIHEDIRTYISIFLIGCYCSYLIFNENN